MAFHSHTSKVVSKQSATTPAAFLLAAGAKMFQVHLLLLLVKELELSEILAFLIQAL